MIDRRVLFFGDSFVAGAGDPAALGWVGRVAAACQPLTAYNLGVRGETSVQVGARWQAETWPRLRVPASYGVVFSVGANDAVGERVEAPPRMSAAATAAAVAELLDGAAQLELPVLLVGPPPLNEPAADERIAELTELYAELAAARRVPYVPVAETLLGSETWRREATAGDGAHPAEAGYALLAELVLAGGFRAWADGLGDDDAPRVGGA